MEEKIGGIAITKSEMEPTNPNLEMEPIDSTSAFVIFDMKGAPTPLSLITTQTSQPLAHKDTKYKRSRSTQGLGSRKKAFALLDYSS